MTASQPIEQAAPIREGGCLCGAIRYDVRWPPLATVICHCTNCQKQAGSALSVVAVFPREHVTMRGELGLYVDRAASGRDVERRFCRSCGSPVLTDTAAARDDGVIFLKAGTLDDTSDLEPTLHYWTDSAQRWVTIPDTVATLPTQ